SILLRCSAERVVNWGPGCSILNTALEKCLLWTGKSPVTTRVTSNRLLDHDLFLVGIYTTFGILRRDRDQVFSVRQRRREIVEAAIVADDRHFLAIHHDAGSRLGFAGDLNHVSVLNQGIEFERQIYFFLRLDDDGKAILFAFHRFLPRRIVRLDGPIVSAHGQSRHNHARGCNLAVEQQGRKIWVMRNAQAVSGGVPHGGPGKLDLPCLLAGIHENRHHVAGRDGRGRTDFRASLHGFGSALEIHFFPVGEAYHFAIALDLAAALLYQNFMLIVFGVVVHHG